MYHTRVHTKKYHTLITQTTVVSVLYEVRCTASILLSVPGSSPTCETEGAVPSMQYTLSILVYVHRALESVTLDASRTSSTALRVC